jgi:GNAT superfamily N-acetyltransferase
MEHSPTTIRKAAGKDLPIVMALWNEYWPEHSRIVLAENPRARPYLQLSPDASPKIAKWFRNVLRSRESAVFLAEISGEVAGFAVILDEPSWVGYRIPRFAFLAILFVREPYRGHGMSRVLTREATQWAKERKLKHISLTVHHGNNRAKAIYRKWDFVEIALVMHKAI